MSRPLHGARWRQLRRLLAIAALASVMPPVAATTLAEAVEAAWSRSAQSVQSAGQLRRAEAERPAAQARWAGPPAVELGLTRERQRAAGTTRETEIGLAIPLWRAGQREARIGEVEALLDVAQAQALGARLRLAGEVREAAAELDLQRAAVEAAQSQRAELAALVQDVERRVAAGDLAPADALQAEAERLVAEAALLQAEQALASRQLHWQALTGLSTTPEPPPDAPAPALPATLDPQHPLLRAAGLQRALAQQQLALARASRSEAPELQLSARQEQAAGEPGTRGLGVALRIPLGTDGWRAPRLSAAATALELAEANERELRLQLQAALDNAFLAWHAAARQQAMQAQRAALLRERAQLIDQSYRAGESPLQERLRALTAAAQADAAAAQARAALAQARSRLEQAHGVLP